MNKLLAVLLSVALAPAWQVALADPITYTLTGIASGSIGTTAFTGQSFTLVGSGDTSGASTAADGSIVNNLTTLKLSVFGLPTVGATHHIQFYALPTASDDGFTDLLTGNDIFDFRASGLSAYNGVAQLSSLAVTSDFPPSFVTSGGTVTLTSVSSLVFSSVVTPAAPSNGADVPTLPQWAGLLLGITLCLASVRKSRGVGNG